MPTYEYECSKCGIFECFQSMSDQPLDRCPTCRSKVRRLIGTGAGIIFKGSGFYQTDYRSSNYNSAASKDRSANKSVASSNTSSSDTASSSTSKKTPATT